MNTPLVFISHSSMDHSAAEMLCAGLEYEGLNCWIAPRDIPPGMHYGEGILHGIGECPLFLVLFSETADESPHVGNEIERAASAGKKLLVVRTDRADPSKNPRISLFLGSHQWFDASTGTITSHIPRLADAIRRVLPATPAADESARSSRTRVPPPSGASSTAMRRSIGVEVGATKIRGYAVDLDDSEHELRTTREYFQATAASTARAVLGQVKDLVGEILEQEFGEAPPVGIGIAAPGQVDLRAGTLKFGPNLFGARNVPFKTSLAGAFPRIPIRVDNEVRCATRYELHAGVGDQFESFACIFIGNGVGSGVVVDQRVLFGHNFCAGEIGHTKIAPTGPPCACGQIGCLETFVKAQAVVTRAEAKAIDYESRGLSTALAQREEPLTPEAIVQAIEQDDAAAKEIAGEVAVNLGLGISNYLNLLNPAAIVIGGGLMTGFFFHMIDEITETVHRHALAEVANTPIVQSAHSDDGIALGAALLFHEDAHWPFDGQRRAAPSH